MDQARRYTLADVRRSYSPEKARDELYGDWMSALVYRPVSFVLTPLFLNLGISATAVTLFSLTLALALPVLAIWSGPDARLWVGLAAVLWDVLDCVDGNIARVTKSASRMGHYLDFVVDVVFRVCLYGTLGFLADAAPYAPAGLSGFGLILALAAALIAALARHCRVTAREMTEGDVYDRPEEARGNPGFVARFVFPFLSGLDRLLPLAILATPLWDGLIWTVLLWLLFYGTLDFLYSQFVIFRALAR